MKDHSTLTIVAYAIACVVVPMVWGVIIVQISNYVEHHVRSRNDKDVPPIEYHI